MIKKRNSIKVDGSITREYIINAMKKDISVETSIFELIDNSINAAEEMDKLRGHYIIIELDENQFVIKDDCGGINPSLIRNVFKIGNRNTDIKGFGVGMKRAIVKLGNEAQLYSYNHVRSFDIPFDIKTWGKDNDWTWNLNEIQYNSNNVEGLEIHIRKLNKEVNLYLKKENELRERISRRYRYILEQGFKIKVNGHIINKYKIKERADAESPTYIIGNGVSVKVKLYCNLPSTEENGWDIFINSRCILERDRSRNIHWNRTKSNRGYCFSRFVGEVFIKGINVKELPQSSSKDKIDFDSELMQKVIEFMYDFLIKNKLLFKKEEVGIQYERDIDDVELLKEYFGLKSAKATGEKSFDRTLEEVKNYNKNKKYSM